MSETSETLRVAALTAHVPESLATQVKALAEQGERSISREVTLALRRHVEAQVSAERREPAWFATGQSTSPARAGEAA